MFKKKKTDPIEAGILKTTVHLPFEEATAYPTTKQEARSVGDYRILTDNGNS